jgi:catechol 2,3-dioxygenase-like lactoylglutathione lyase family enzyme
MMTSAEPRCTLDHVELFVPDRPAAAAWYARVLGCQAVPGTEAWAADPQGPLMISPDAGCTKLALFTGEPQGGRATAGFHRVAFRTDGSAFLDFARRVQDLGLADAGGPVRVVDHGQAWSVYFADPYGHRLELTTYDAAEVRAARATPSDPAHDRGTNRR